MKSVFKRPGVRHARAFLFALSLVLVHGHSAAAKDKPLAQPTEEKTHRVVYQVTLDGEDNWNAILNQIENLKKGFAPEKVEIEIVAFGNAAGFVLAKNTAISERIQKITADGAKVEFCANTQRRNNIKPEEITPGVTIVPAGIVQVIKRQEEGWSYVKAGP